MSPSFKDSVIPGSLSQQWILSLRGLTVEVAAKLIKLQHMPFALEIYRML